MRFYMQKIFFTCLIALGMSFNSQAFAQDTTQTTPEAQEVPKSTTTDDETFPVAQDPKDVPGTEYVTEEHGDWKIICTSKGKDIAPNCRLYQLLKDDSGSPVAEFGIIALAKDAQAAAGVNFVTPLGTLLTAQASMRIDSGQTKRYPFSWCEQAGCITRFGLTKVELDNLKKGNKAVMIITAVAAPNDPIPLDVSLTGFTSAWDALNKE
jgi:invasion protein IalB